MIINDDFLQSLRLLTAQVLLDKIRNKKRLDETDCKVLQIILKHYIYFITNNSNKGDLK